MSNPTSQLQGVARSRMAENGFQQDRFLDGFGQDAIASDGFDSSLVFRVRVRRQRKNRSRRNALFHFPFPDGRSRGIAIHHRHVYVHQDQVVAADGHHVTGDAAIFRDVHLVWRRFQVGLDQELVIRGIFHNENS